MLQETREAILTEIKKRDRLESAPLSQLISLYNKIEDAEQKNRTIFAKLFKDLPPDFTLDGMELLSLFMQLPLEDQAALLEQARSRLHA